MYRIESIVIGGKIMSKSSKLNKLRSAVALNPFTGELGSRSKPLKFSTLGREVMEWKGGEVSIPQFRLNLYRFLRDNVPLLSSCIWTWSRLASAPGKYEIIGDLSDSEQSAAEESLRRMSLSVFPFKFQKMAGYESFLPFLFSTLFTDGAFAGFVILESDAGGIDRFVPVESGNIVSRSDHKGGRRLVYSSGDKELRLDSDDFYYLGLDTDQQSGLGQSILKSISFMAYIEQQLIDDMRKAVHNAGYHRLHVQITPPDKMSGEADNAYVNRVNEYFDETVSMIRGCSPEDNPVTWDNVKIEYVGPRNVTGVGNSWFMNHRTMVEEICAGTNLSPFMLGYSYGTTHNWAHFKYDLVMRQIVSVQRQTARFLEWLGNIELALKGFDCRCQYEFDNSLSHNALDLTQVKEKNIESLLKLYEAGLIDKEQAIKKVGRLI